MATFVKVNEISNEIITNTKNAPQAKILAKYLSENFAGETVNQQDLLLEMNTHQSDNMIFPYTPKNPISSIYQYYRPSLIALGVIEVNKETKETGVSKKQKELLEYVAKMEKLLEENGIEVK